MLKKIKKNDLTINQIICNNQSYIVYFVNKKSGYKTIYYIDFLYFGLFCDKLRMRICQAYNFTENNYMFSWINGSKNGKFKLNANFESLEKYLKDYFIFVKVMDIRDIFQRNYFQWLINKQNMHKKN